MAKHPQPKNLKEAKAMLTRERHANARLNRVIDAFQGDASRTAGEIVEAVAARGLRQTRADALRAQGRGRR